MTTKFKANRFPQPKLAPELLRGRRISDPIDHKAAKSVEGIARIVGAGAACVPTCYVGGLVTFNRSTKLKGLEGHAACVGKKVTLRLNGLSLGEAAAALHTLAFMRKAGKR